MLVGYQPVLIKCQQFYKFHVTLIYSAIYSFAGCPEAAMANIFNAVDAISTLGGIGLILAQWSGLGHLTSHSISWPAFIAMAGLSWNHQIHSVRFFG